MLPLKRRLSGHLEMVILLLMVFATDLEAIPCSLDAGQKRLGGTKARHHAQCNEVAMVA